MRRAVRERLAAMPASGPTRGGGRWPQFNTTDDPPRGMTDAGVERALDPLTAAIPERKDIGLATEAAPEQATATPDLLRVRGGAESGILTSTPVEKGKPTRLLDVHELAAHLGVKPGWVYDHCREGAEPQIPSFKLGIFRRFRLDEIERWLASISSAP